MPESDEEKSSLYPSRVCADHDVSLSSRATIGEDEIRDSCTVSIRKEVDSKGMLAHYIVWWKGGSVALGRRFSSQGSEDPQGRAAALRFALSTDSLPAFRAFLFEHPRSTDGFTSTAVPTVFLSPRKNTLFRLSFTVAICRLQDGSLRSLSFRNSSEHAEPGIAQATKFLHSSAFGKWLQRRDLTYTNEKGSSEISGSSAAKCQNCKAWENEEPHFLQVSKDYLCSVCIMLEKTRIISVRLEEQMGGVAKLADIWNEARSVYMDCNVDTCCVCGCEDNEALDELVPCSCKFGQAVVHANCEVACAESKFLALDPTSSFCPICGKGKGTLQNGAERNEELERGSKRSLESSQTGGLAVKRQRKNSPSNVHVEESIFSPTVCEVENNVLVTHMESKDTNAAKIGAARHWRCSTDGPAVVPFKKRRIQVAEFTRVPSPPPVEVCLKASPILAPQTVPSASDSPFPKHIEDMPTSPTSIRVGSPSSECGSLLPSSSACKVFRSPTELSSQTALRSEVLSFLSPVTSGSSSSKNLPGCLSITPESDISSIKQTLPLRENLSSKCISPSRKVIPQRYSAIASCQPLEVPSAEPLEQPTRTSSSDVVRESSSYLFKLQNKVVQVAHVSHSGREIQASSSQEVEDGELVVSIEKDTEDAELAIVLSDASSKGDRSRQRKVVRAGFGDVPNDRSRWDLNAEGCGNLYDMVGYSQLKMRKSVNSACQTVGGSFNRSQQTVKVSESSKNQNIVPSKAQMEGTRPNEDGISSCTSVSHSNKVLVDGKDLVVHQNLEIGKVESGKHAHTSGNLVVFEGSRVKDDQVSDIVGRKHGLHDGEHDWLNGKWATSINMNRKEPNQLTEDPEVEDGAPCYDYDWRDIDPETYYNNRLLIVEDEALWNVEETNRNLHLWERRKLPRCGERRVQCLRSKRVKTSGWDQLPEGFESAEEAMKAVREAYSSRRNCRSWMSSSMAGAVCRFNSVREARDCFSLSNEFRRRKFDEPLHGRDSFSHRRRLDDDDEDCSVARGRVLERGATGAHGQGQWSDNEQSDMFRQRGSGLTSGFSPDKAGAMAQSRDFVGGHDETIPVNDRPGRPFGGSRVRAPPPFASTVPTADMEIGPNHKTRIVDRDMCKSSKSGRGFDGSMSARGSFAGHEIMDRYERGLNSRISMSGRGSFAGHEIMDRYERGLHSRRIESPLRMLPRNHCSPDSPGPFVRREPRLRSRVSPPSPESYGGHPRVSSSSLEPHSRRPRIFSRSRLSPPLDRRDIEEFSHRDTKRRTPHSIRTSPHVVHGSSLMDDRDLQVLAQRGGTLGSRRSKRGEHDDHGRLSPRAVEKRRDTRGRDRSWNERKEKSHGCASSSGRHDDDEVAFRTLRL